MNLTSLIPAPYRWLALAMLAVALVAFGWLRGAQHQEQADAVQLASVQLRPHFLCLYLFELAGAYSTFYAADKVIVDDPAVRGRRLLLCHRTLLTLETGLHLLGLRTLERM